MQAHGGVERLFSSVAEGWMADVMDQGQGLREVFVESELGGDSAGNLRDLDGVRQTVAKMIGVTARKDLSLCLQTPESAGMDDAVAIALKVVSVGMGRLEMAASAGVFYVDGVVGELAISGQV